LLGDAREGGAPAAPREIQGRMFDVMLRLGQGDTVKAIAADMGVSVKTVGTYRTRLLEKLHLKSNVDIVRYCLIHGLVN
jgi:DNA-binding NarL/FixJ family response regulator